MKETDQLATKLVDESLAAWKEQGGRVVGYACVFTPVELLDAAGLLAYRIKALGNARTDLADARLSRLNCGYCRSCLQLALEGAYDFLDGLVETNGCDQLRGMFEHWQRDKNPRFFHYLKVPHLDTEDALLYFEHQLELWRRALESHFDVEVTDDKLWQAIELREELRQQLRQLNALRERESPALSGAEVLSIIVAGSSMPPQRFAKILAQVLFRTPRKPWSRPRARLLLGGSATDEVQLVRDLEAVGGLVVTDTLCFGARAAWPDLQLPRASSPLRVLAERYVRHGHCPRMFDKFDSRLELVWSAARRARVQGAVLVHNKFCDAHGIENALLRLRLEERGLPVLTLEKEYGAAADRGRIKTRVQAFLERISGS